MIERFSNEKIQLCRLKKSDAIDVYHALKHSINEISPWLNWLTEEYDLKSADKFIALQINNWLKNEEFTYAIKTLKGEFVGMIGLHMFDSVNDVASIGYWVDSRLTNKGYCTQAVKLLASSCLKLLNLIRIEIIVAIKNLASQKVAENAGAHFEAILKNRIRLNGEPVDAKIYVFITS